VSGVETIGRATLYLGDAREILPTLGPIAAVVTDPPYGMAYKSGHNSSRRGAGLSMARKDGNFKPINGDKTPFDPAFILALGVPTILWGANHYNDKLQPGTRWLVWNKLIGKTPLPSGSDLEMAWCSEKGPDRIFDHLWRGIMRAGEENIVHSAKLHPNQKPVALMAWCLAFVPSGTVLDPFMGSASTGVACLRAGREFIGIDDDPEHFETACKRIEDAQRQGSLFEAAA
jgi:site-specific DNA-methyltransferase (adenine-specific)